MTDINNLNDIDCYNLLRSLGNFLKADVGVMCGKIERIVRTATERKTVVNDGYNIRVTISNTAPTESNYPLIVFVGVGLRVQFPKTLQRSIQRMKNQDNLTVDLSNATQSNPLPISEAIRVDSPEYPHLTSDEQKHGHILFPNQSIIYDMSLTAKECPNINEIKLWAEGTISRRHLFHQSKQITIAGENIVYQL